MSPRHRIIAVLVTVIAAATTPAQADDKAPSADALHGADAAKSAQSTPAGKAPALADMPFMKEEAKRLAALMERLQKTTDPAERRKIMAETSCAQ